MRDDDKADVVISLGEGEVPNQNVAAPRGAPGVTTSGPDGLYAHSQVVAPGEVAGSVVVDEAPAAVIDEDTDQAALPERAVRNADGSVTLPLLFPVSLQIRSANGSVRSERYAELVLCRLTGADLRAIALASKESAGAVMLARSARLRQPIMNALFDRADGGDLADAMRCIESFFGSGPTTGR